MYSRARVEAKMHAAISNASGKKLGEAVNILSDAVEELFNEFSPKQDTFVIEGPPPEDWPDSDSLPRAVIRKPIERLEELAPISAPSGKPKPAVYREYQSVQDIMGIVSSDSPAIITIKIAGPEGPMDLDLLKSIATVNDGVQLIYRPRGSSPDTPCPKAFFWTTDEFVDINKAIESIKRDAQAMYIRRSSPVISKAVNMGPVELRLNAGEPV